MIKKADIILIFFLLLAGFGGWYFLSSTLSQGDTVTISIDGRIYGNYPLNVNRKIFLKQGDEFNTVLIENSEVRILEANCAGQECVHQGAISKSGESIICLPHKTVVEITNQNSSYDAIVS